MKKCPRCSSELGVNDKVCPKCRLEVSKMEDYAKTLDYEPEPIEPVQENQEKQEEPKKTKAQKRLEKIEAKKAKKQAKLERKKRESKSDTDFSKFASNSEESSDETLGEQTFSKRMKNRKKKDTTPQFELDENGEFNIDTKDVEIVGEETGKIIEEQYNKSYSVKKARGDYRPPKIKWWELYKIADRSFARRKIKKEVNKAAIQKPSFISKTKLLLLAIFFGWMGAHNFYAKNYKKGWVSTICVLIASGVMVLKDYSRFFQLISFSAIGFSGFVFLLIWISDLISIIIGRFKYRIQKEAFIFGMNIETRAKLGEKYIDLELYQKPWWVRFKVWCQNKHRDFEEYKKERHQAKIQKEKRKLQKQQEQEKIDAEIAEFEAKETEKLEQEKLDATNKQSKTQKKDISKVIDKQTLREINSFDGGLTEAKPESDKKFVDNKNKAKKSFKTKNKKK